ncbi:MAG: hypothetical protein FVQ77_01825 [Cytophagales bacterium]|nr:hypothetical protein [Cytophagales bacterium]
MDGIVRPLRVALALESGQTNSVGKIKVIINFSIILIKPFKIMKLKYLIYCLVLSILIFSCERKKRAAATSEEAIAKVKVDIEALSDSIKIAWEEMIADDDQMLSDIKRLLEEISYTSKYNVLLHDSLIKLREKLIQARYDENSMAASEKIDQYDELTDSLINGLMRLLTTTPDIASYPLCGELISEIKHSYNKAILYRIGYDDWAKKYNEYIKKNKKQIKKLGRQYKEKPLFEIQD